MYTHVSGSYRVLYEGLKNRSFYDLIEQCSYDAKTKRKLHKLREYRNKWVHINEQKECNIQIDYVELEEMALFAYRLTLEVFHYYPFTLVSTKKS